MEEFPVISITGNQLEQEEHSVNNLLEGLKHVL